MKKNIHLSIMIVMLSLALFSSYHIYYYFIDKESNELKESYYNNISFEEKKQIVKKLDNVIKEEYLGIIKIPKINLEEGFYNINSAKNNINTSVTILKESTLPNNNGSVMYLVAHSGTGYLAFFKDLNKLSINDIVEINLNNVKYKYIINDIYELEKNGKIMVNHNIHENYLVLSTCSKNNKQLVITSKLIMQ